MLDLTRFRFDEGNVSIALFADSVKQISNIGDDDNPHIKVELINGDLHYISGNDANRIFQEYSDYLETENRKKLLRDWLLKN